VNSEAGKPGTNSRGGFMASEMISKKDARSPSSEFRSQECSFSSPSGWHLPGYWAQQACAPTAPLCSRIGSSVLLKIKILASHDDLPGGPSSREAARFERPRGSSALPLWLRREPR
jgi:hypothetical protein